VTIRIETAPIYRGGGRRYLTKRAAIKAEAIAAIKKKHPTEQPEFENGHMIYAGFHCTSLPRFGVLLRRMMRLVRIEATQ
jgi:hypothetical protein